MLSYDQKELTHQSQQKYSKLNFPHDSGVLANVLGKYCVCLWLSYGFFLKCSSLRCDSSVKLLLSPKSGPPASMGINLKFLTILYLDTLNINPANLSSCTHAQVAEVAEDP